MTRKTDTFFVVDFDRCIDNVEGSFDILKEVVHDLSIIDRQIFKSMREEIESSGLTFSALEHIKKYSPSVNLDDIEKLYSERTKLEPDNLLEPGAVDFINFLKSTNCNFCIMSFGDKRWQTIKISNSGIGKVPLVIVPNSQKSDYIRKWLVPKTNKFKIPKNFFKDNNSKEVSEVVLIEDKIAAFNNLPLGTRRYYVSGSSSKHIEQLLDKLPISVKKIQHIDEIITYESIDK